MLGVNKKKGIHGTNIKERQLKIVEAHKSHLSHFVSKQIE